MYVSHLKVYILFSKLNFNAYGYPVKEEDIHISAHLCAPTISNTHCKRQLKSPVNACLLQQSQIRDVNWPASVEDVQID